MNTVNVKIKVLKEGCLPQYAYSTDACADCFANIDKPVVIHAFDGGNPDDNRVSIPLGFGLQLSEGWKAVIETRSGLPKKNGILAVHGEIDQGYIGEVCTTLINTSGKEFVVHPGDRVCQIKFEPFYHAEFLLVDELKATDRGANGFGSSGVSKQLLLVVCLVPLSR